MTDPQPPVGPPPSTPPPGYYPAPAQTNGMAVASLVLGIVSLVACGPAGILALIFGSRAKKEIAGSNGTQTGAGMAQAGWVCGLIALVIWGLVIGLIVAATLLGKSASSKFSVVGGSLG